LFFSLAKTAAMLSFSGVAPVRMAFSRAGISSSTIY